MEEHIVKILDIEVVTHDVRRFRVEKPGGYTFNPGQATEVSIDTPALRDEKRPFTFTCLNSDNFLEFTIKIYSDHDGVTNQLSKLNRGDHLIIRDVWGDIGFREKGLFIAGGAGITPFIAILRDLSVKKKLQGNTLIFANKSREDIILEHELKKLLGHSFINILSEENTPGYSTGFITKQFILDNIPPDCTNYYLCGPPPMMDAVLTHLSSLGVSPGSIIMEKM